MSIKTKSRAPHIDHCAADNWPWLLTSIFDLDLKARTMATNSDVKTRFLAFELDPGPRPTMPRSKVKWFSQKSTDKHKDWCYQIYYLLALWWIIINMRKNNLLSCPSTMSFAPLLSLSHNRAMCFLSFVVSFSIARGCGFTVWSFADLARQVRSKCVIDASTVSSQP